MTPAVRIYTRGGDEGKTSLFDGARVSKSDARVDVYGTIDELNSALSLCRVAAPKEVAEAVERIQNELFTLGADFATPLSSPKSQTRAKREHWQRMEKDIDRFMQDVGNPQGFVLPGETEEGARLHLARTVCRRAERLAVAFSERQPINPDAIKYLNRLSDLLYAMAVWSDKVARGKTLRKARYE